MIFIMAFVNNSIIYKEKLHSLIAEAKIKR